MRCTGEEIELRRDDAVDDDTFPYFFGQPKQGESFEEAFRKYECGEVNQKLNSSNMYLWLDMQCWFIMKPSVKEDI